jgi:predicted dehydrogenase
MQEDNTMPLSLPLGVAVVGCGGIGTRRAATAAENERTRLVAVADVAAERAQGVAARFNCAWSTNWEEVVGRDDVQLVIVSTSNDAHAPVSIAAMERGKHVLCEKPLARNPEEARQMVETARRYNVKLKTGFNHRFHHQVQKARELYEAGAIGELIFIRARTGHGGGEAFAQSWFAKKERSGGGTFLDNGVHLLDLARWFMGEFVQASGFVSTNLWLIAPCEDNGFGLFRTADNRVASLHSSWTQWRGYLYMELWGTKGFLIIDYEPPRTVLVQRERGPSGESVEQVFSFAGVRDRSWERDLEEMVRAILEDREPLASGYDGLRAVEMAYAVYRSSETGMAVAL